MKKTIKISLFLAVCAFSSCINRNQNLSNFILEFKVQKKERSFLFNNCHTPFIKIVIINERNQDTVALGILKDIACIESIAKSSFLDTWSIEVVDSVYNGYCLDHKRKNDFFYECVADFQKGNISILNNALKNYFKIKYNKLTEQDKYKIISWVCELERIDGGMEHTVYSEVSEDWKVFEYECLNLRNQHFMDSLCQQELSSSPGYNHCPYDSEFKIYQFEGRCKQMFIDRKIRDYSRFYIVFDENLVGTTLCHKFLFEYHFFEDKDGFLQITKKILNPEVGGYNRCG